MAIYSVYVSNGAIKQEAARELGIPVARLPKYVMDAMAAEEADQDKTLGLQPEQAVIPGHVDNYPEVMALAKMNALMFCAPKLSVALMGQWLLVTDAVWKIGGNLVNKPDTDENTREIVGLWSWALETRVPLENVAAAVSAIPGEDMGVLVTARQQIILNGYRPSNEVVIGYVTRQPQFSAGISTLQVTDGFPGTRVKGIVTSRLVDLITGLPLGEIGGWGYEVAAEPINRVLVNGGALGLLPVA